MENGQQRDNPCTGINYTEFLWKFHFLEELKLFEVSKMEWETVDFYKSPAHFQSISPIIEKTYISLFVAFCFFQFYIFAAL